ncbi:hypothetical protein Taro_017521 [Colocasia esculenta]|uniref:Uncharacterized protein n=1 Tax=Colocasia esculenta TaxID=4460 RepID=A0A843URE2_COLES|nr:hypothetical protein [Colocasia esculenta]
MLGYRCAKQKITSPRSFRRTPPPAAMPEECLRAPLLSRSELETSSSDGEMKYRGLSLPSVVVRRLFRNASLVGYPRFFVSQARVFVVLGVLSRYSVVPLRSLPRMAL